MLSCNEKSRIPEAINSRCDSLAVLKIGEDMWLKSNGEDLSYKSILRFEISQDSLKWYVNVYLPDSMKGGLLNLEIRKADCEVLTALYGK